MRIRRLKNTDQIMQESAYIVKDPENRKGQWRQHFIPAASFASGRRLEIEIGCGRGRFICDMARLHPLTDFIGIEYVSTVLARTAKLLDLSEKSPIRNLELLYYDAQELEKVFKEGEVDRIYLNFSDPWPKKKHTKRRLTSERFLPVYERILSKAGDLVMKTDNDDLFAFTLETLGQRKWTVLEKTDDLHKSAFNAANVMTEYEKNFTEKGKNIHYLHAIPPLVRGKVTDQPPKPEFTDQPPKPEFII